MFTYSSDEIDTFKELYNNADQEPVLVKETSLVSTVTSRGKRFENNFRIYPNPTSGFVYIENSRPFKEVSFYEMDGRLSHHFDTTSELPGNLLKVNAPAKNGLYLLVLKTDEGEVFTDKILVN